MAQDNFHTPFSTIGGSLPGIFLRAFKQRKIDPPYRVRWFVSFLASCFVAPFGWFEKLAVKRKISGYEIKEDPIFILGHWRSGTTFLHNLFCEDPQNGFVTTFQGVFPHVILKGAWLFKNFMQVAMPKTRASDNMPIFPDAPQEEEFGMGNVNNYCYYYFWYFPRETRSLIRRYGTFESSDQMERMEWKKDYFDFIKRALVYTGRKRFVSKNPPHTFRVRLLLEMFPNAKFVYIYRNPVTVFVSTLKLLEKTLPSLQFQDISKEQLVDDIFFVYKEMFQQFEKDKHLIPSDNLVEIRYEDFVTNPLKNMEQVYADLNLPGFNEAKPPIQSHLEQMKDFKPGKHKIKRQLLERILEEWSDSFNHWNYSLPGDLEIVD